jgi:hypothetical protein
MSTERLTFGIGIGVNLGLGTKASTPKVPKIVSNAVPYPMV